MSGLCAVSSYERDIVHKGEFQTLVDDYSGQVLSTAVRILGDPEKAPGRASGRPSLRYGNDGTNTITMTCHDGVVSDPEKLLT